MDEDELEDLVILPGGTVIEINKDGTGFGYAKVPEKVCDVCGGTTGPWKMHIAIPADGPERVYLVHEGCQDFALDEA